MSHEDYTDPTPIAKDVVDTIADVLGYLSEKGIPHTTEDARAIAISAHIEAAKRGYRPPESVEMHHGTPAENGQPRAGMPPHREPTDDARPVDGPDNGPEGEMVSDEPHPDWQQPSQGFTYDSPHPVSERQKERVDHLLAKATRVVNGNAKMGLVKAEAVVKSAIYENFEEQRGHKPNITSWTRMTSGDCSWVIDFLMRTWSVR